LNSESTGRKSRAFLFVSTPPGKQLSPNSIRTWNLARHRGHFWSPALLYGRFLSSLLRFAVETSCATVYHIEK
jgi:hypothetical protein